MLRPALAVALALAAAAPALSANSTREIAPGGRITSVAETTTAIGWPHEGTEQEANDVANLAIMRAAARAPRLSELSVLCYFGPWISRAYCGVVVTSRGSRPQRYRLDVRVWEDGAYRFTRRGGAR